MRRMEPQRCSAEREGLSAAKLPAGKINLIAPHGKPQMPEVHPNLIRAAGEWSCLEQGGAVGVAPQHAKFGARRHSVLRIHGSRAMLASVGTDGSIAFEFILG